MTWDATWHIEVDVLVTRPPIPSNTRTATVVLAAPADTWTDEYNAHLTAIHMIWLSRANIEMPMACRTVLVEI